MAILYIKIKYDFAPYKKLMKYFKYIMIRKI